MAVRSICLAGIEKSTDFQLGGALIVTPLGVFRLGVREGIDIGQGVKTFCNVFSRQVGRWMAQGYKCLSRK